MDRSTDLGEPAERDRASAPVPTLPTRPTSCTSDRTAAAGLLGFAVAAAAIWAYRPQGDGVGPAMVLVATVAAAVTAVDLGLEHVHRRPSAGLDFGRWTPSIGRTAVKAVGLLATWVPLALAYWLFPEYRGSFYDRYFQAIGWIGPIVAVAALPYLFVVDAVMVEPRDGCWHTGMAVLGRRHAVSATLVGQHLRGWLVKWFFLPLMFVGLCDQMTIITNGSTSPFADFSSVYEFAFGFLYFVDLVFAVVGYVVSLRLTDTHLRSAEPTLLGWVAALVCYEPFWSLIGRQYLAYDTDLTWGAWFASSPVSGMLWGSTILALVAIYAWSTIMFGCRFSNLTHRGIVTSGPYRFTKHPAYIAKNLSWWMISLPFLAEGGAEALRHSLLLFGVGGIYALRAWTEERHLARDPDYVAYAEWIAAHGLFRRRGRWWSASRRAP